MAFADWQFLLEYDHTKIYAQVKKIKRVGNVASTYLMYDYPQPKGLGPNAYRSTMSYVDFDCKNEKLRIQSIVGYTESKGTGKAIGPEKGSEWAVIFPGSIDETLMKRICQN